jgi:hypothetical protein
VGSSDPAARQFSRNEKWIVAERQSEVRIDADDVGNVRLLSLKGALDAATYRSVRDAIVKAALDEPQTLVVDVTELIVREDPAWAVFTSARWQISEWPDVPIALVCAHEQGQNALRRNGITRHVPVYPTLDSAIAGSSAEQQRRYRRRARASIPAHRKSIRRCRELTAEWLSAWSRTDFTHVVSLVATELVEAALAATDTDFVLRLETDGSTVAVVVQHVGIANRVDRKSLSDNVSGLDLVAANTRTWGTYTTLWGNTVWGVVGPENRF